MITIAYDNRYGTLYRLLFAGLNAKGNPQWVSLTPGEIMKNESKWMEVRVDEFYHLCKEGEEVPSYLVARLLGMTFDHKSYRGRAMKNLLSKMQSDCFEDLVAAGVHHLRRKRGRQRKLSSESG